MKKNAIIFFSLFLLLLCCLPMQAGDSIDKIRNDRYRRIGFYHLGAEFWVGGTDNMDCSVLLMAGCGSNRNLLNVDLGIGYDYSTALPTEPSHRIFGHRIPLVISFAFNLWRNEKDCLYLGGGYSYGIAVGASYKEGNRIIRDGGLVKNSSSALAEIGYRWNVLDFAVRCSWATAPKYDQKYIYETEAYDYNVVNRQIFNRLQVGFALTYYFYFGL